MNPGRQTLEKRRREFGSEKDICLLVAIMIIAMVIVVALPGPQKYVKQWPSTMLKGFGPLFYILFIRVHEVVTSTSSD